MPLRRFRPRRRLRRRPRNMIRRRPVMRRTRAPQRMMAHWFKRTCKLGNISASISGGVPSGIASAYSFSLSQLPSFTEFTNLYDQYKITGAKMSFVPGATEALYSPLSGVASQHGYNRFHSVIDYDDSTPPISEDQMLQYQSVKTTNGLRTHTRYLKPKVLREVYRSALTTGYNPTASQWIDTVQNDVPHYGLKVWCDAPFSSTNASITYTVYLTLYFGCKNVR